MKFKKPDRKSIAYRLTVIVIAIIIGQAALLSLFLIIGGVISQAEQNAYSSFSDKVKSRTDSLQGEMRYHWTNMDPYMDQISEQYDQEEEPEQYFDRISEVLISMLRTTQATGAFVILEEPSDGSEKPALYIRDYDPRLNDYDNKDLYLVYGPSGIASELQIPLDYMWKSRMDLDIVRADFYTKPLSKASLTSESSLLGYWSVPFKLNSKDISIITYSMPLFDKNKQRIGVIGVEVSEQYLAKFLPATDLQNRDSYGYMIGYERSGEEVMRSIILTKEIQKRITRAGAKLEYTSADEEHSIYFLKDQKTNSKLYLAVESLGIYNNNTPFEQNQWYLIGIMQESRLLGHVTKIRFILAVSLLCSIVIGGMIGYVVSHWFTKPIIRLAEKVNLNSYARVTELEDTGLKEVDDLLKTIQVAGNMLMESESKMSRAIELLGISFGIYEYAANRNSVFVTTQTPALLSLDETEAREIFRKRDHFIRMIQDILSRPVDHEKDIYYASQNPKKWLRIRQVEINHTTLGVIIDVTQEMLEKQEMIKDRDMDALTNIYNRKAMQVYMEKALDSRELTKVSALLMLDLDHLKNINDTYGHNWGDSYIRHAVRHLMEIDSEQMLLGRRSGDEFVLLFYDYESKEQIRALMESFYERISRDPLSYPDGTHAPVGISAGLVWIGQDTLTFEEYLQQADDWMYEAKKKKKGSYYEEETAM